MIFNWDIGRERRRERQRQRYKERGVNCENNKLRLEQMHCYFKKCKIYFEILLFSSLRCLCPNNGDHTTLERPYKENFGDILLI